MTRIAKDGDKVRLLSGDNSGAVGYVREDGTDVPELVGSHGGDRIHLLWLFPEEEGKYWEFVSSAEAAISEGYVDTDAFLEIRFEDKVDAVLADVKAKLIAKNNQYGNSALEPIRAFSKLNPVEQLLIRIDDKISRLQKGDGTGDEDAEADTLGYLILLAIARKDNR